MHKPECKCKECERIEYEDLRADEELSYRKDMRRYLKDRDEDFQEEIDAYNAAYDRSRY